MPGNLTIEELILRLELVTKEFMTFCTSITGEIFFRQPVEKWSIAQNVNHLTTSANMTKLVYRLPAFFIRIYSGKPNRPSRTYDELVSKYKSKLELGGRASGRFIAKPVSPAIGKDKVLQIFSTSMSSLIAVIKSKWNDVLLDNYLAPHPLLGKITLRELCYFTIYHTEHHLSIIKERLND